ncbi:hypothetical protein GCM10009415_53270 [Chitinophaga japonensis]
MQKMHEQHGMDMQPEAPMSHAFSLNLPMNRNGSGTGWLPDASPMYGYMIHAKKWMYMVHGNIFIRYNKQDIADKGVRGDESWDAPNWVMMMGQRRVGKNGLFHFSGMFSLDAAIAGKSGYPLLFQTGETYKGQPLVDRQHPHDLFSELSVSYAYAFSKKVDVFIYIGYPGEPALGSVAFMHRPSALPDPDAPISHHWNDATHITFGVATLGVRYDKFKLEASSFTGREPDEDRYNFDKVRFDSRSVRLSYNPSTNWALQVSHGFVKSPEVLHPDEDIYRTTASAVTTYPLGNSRFINATAIWALNKVKEKDGENAALAELAYTTRKIALFSRYEWIQKSTEELNLDESIYGKEGRFPVNALTIGFNYNVLEVKKTILAVGGHLIWFHPDQTLADLYGKNPLSLEVYLRIYPGLMRMNMKM